MASLVVLVAVVVISAHLGCTRLAIKLFMVDAVGLASIFGAILLVSLTTPQRVLAMGEKRCFDDWCVTVEDVTLTRQLGEGEQAAQANGIFYVVTLRLANDSRGQDQRASSAAIHLVDRQGQTYDVSHQEQAAYETQAGPVPLLTFTIFTGQSLDTVQVFDLPAGAQDVGLMIEHPVGPAPGLFIIGDDASLLHKPTIVRLP